MRRFLILCVAMLGLSVGAGAQAPSDRFTVGDFFNLEFAADPQISPDGQWVAYVRRFADVMTDKNYSNIWLVRADGSGHRPLTTGKVNDGTPRWSPDGRRLAYIGNAGGTPQIMVRWMESGQVAPVTSVTEPPQSISWSPDGQWIAFTKLVPVPPLVIGQLPASPPGAQWAPPAKYTDRLAFRWNGVGEVPTGFVHVFVVPSEGGTARQLTSGNFHHGGTPFGGGSGVSWTPDGSAVLFSANRRADWETQGADTEVFEVTVATGAMRQLTDRRGPDNDPVVSPDGKLMAWTGFDERYQGYQNTRLYVANRDGSGVRAVSSGLDQSVSSPSWAADSHGLYVMYDEHGNTKLALIGLDLKSRVLASDLGTGGSSYSGASYSVAGDGSYAFTLSTPYLPGDVAVGRGGQPPKTLTTLNADLFAGKTIGQVEELWYESSKDGRRIQGWIVKPPGFDPSRKYPLVLEIHGGPFANYGNRFDAEKQAVASMGFVVLYLNPRGSTSYGEEFGNLIHHAYPGDDFYDLNSGVDAVIAKGYVDDRNLFVTGGSGGGVLTAWMIGHTDRFRAALAFYPVINWESFVLTADMSSRAATNWFPGPPWDQRENYDRRSLLSVVKNVKTPTLIMTGEEDFRTPMSESEQYYKALKLLGVPTVLVRVPGEPHGIRVRPSHWMSKVTTMQGWFDRYRQMTP